MSKNAKRILMLVGGGILALLIVLALFGNTYARYTSVGEGDATVSVALWDVESVPVTISGTSLSPSKDSYTLASHRESRSRWIKVFDVVNNSDVDAALYFNVEGDADGVRFSWKNGFTWGDGMEDLASNDYGRKLMAHFGSEEDFKAVVYGYEVFLIQLGMEVDPSLREKKYGDQDPVVGDDETYVVPAYSTRYEGTYDEGEEHWVSSVFREDNEVAANGGKNAVYANVYWRSLYEGEVDEDALLSFDFASMAEFSDAVDTILCMYAEDISFVVSLNTVQASTLP